MSGLLAGKVWQSNLASHLKPLAAALADIANDDGTSIYPSVDYVAWLLGKGRRSVQIGLAELKQLNIIEPVGSDRGGRGLPTEYQMIEANLPERIPWKEFRLIIRKGASDASFTDRERVYSATPKGRIIEHERAHSTTERMHPGSPDPSDPLDQPSEGTANARATPKSQVETIFEFWRKWLDHPDAKLVPDGKRDKNIRARLKEGYSVDYIRLAIIGCSILPHNMGVNDRGRKFDDIELICRESVKLEGFHDEAIRVGITDPDAWVARMEQAKGHQARVAAEHLAPTQTPVAVHEPLDPESDFGKFCQALKEKISTQSFDTWFRPLRSAGLSPAGNLIIAAPNAMVRDWIMSQYYAQIADALGEERQIEWRLPTNGNGASAPT